MVVVDKPNQDWLEGYHRQQQQQTPHKLDLNAATRGFFPASYVSALLPPHDVGDDTTSSECSGTGAFPYNP